MPVLSLYFRVFFWTGLPFGLLTAAYNALMIAPLKGLIIGVWAGAAFGALMSLILVSLHWFTVARFKHESDFDPGRVKQTRSVTLNMAVEEVFDRCLQAFEAIGPCEILEDDKHRGYIKAQTPGSLKSFGEIMEINLTDAGSDKTALTVLSRPATRTTLVDFGKGMENVQRFLQEVTGFQYG